MTVSVSSRCWQWPIAVMPTGLDNPGGLVSRDDALWSRQTRRSGAQSAIAIATRTATRKDQHVERIYGKGAPSWWAERISMRTTILAAPVTHYPYVCAGHRC